MGGRLHDLAELSPVRAAGDVLLAGASIFDEEQGMGLVLLLQAVNDPVELVRGGRGIGHLLPSFLG